MTALGIGIATIASFLASFALYAIPAVSALIGRTSTPRPGVPVLVQMLSVLIVGRVETKHSTGAPIAEEVASVSWSRT